MRPEARAAAFLWDAVAFARNVGVAVGTTSLEAYVEGGPVAWATERQIELVGEALSNLRRAAPELAERIPDVHKIIDPECARPRLHRGEQHHRLAGRDPGHSGVDPDPGDSSRRSRAA